MKKLLAILLALVLVLVNVAALAEAPAYKPGTGADEGKDTVGSPRLSEPLANGGTITIGKSYTLQILEGAKLPVTDIAFAAELKSITNSTVTVDDMKGKDISFAFTNPTAETNLSGDTYSAGNITITFPTYPEVGVYEYTLTESGSNYAGLTYSDPITLKVTVVRLEGVLKIAGIAFRTDTEKLSEITNAYEAGTLEVKKTVTGNMGDRNKPFTIKVTFETDGTATVNSTIGIALTGTAAVTTEGITDSIPAAKWTSKDVEFTLKHDDTITFTNVPAGVKYTITETDYTGEGYDTASIDKPTGTMAHDKIAANVTNNKDMPIDTGIATETAAYVMILALALIGAAMLILRKREDY